MPPKPLQTFTLTLLGDLMLGRLIDQLLPTHVPNPSEASLISHFISKNPSLAHYSHRTPWGNTLPLLHTSDLVLGNLETAATVCEEKWPDKVFNYRMHPANLGVLRVGGVDYVNLANNHTLDFGLGGFKETIRAVRGVGVAFSGVGEDAMESWEGARLRLPRDGNGEEGGGYEVRVYSASDHPTEWASVPGFHFMDYSASTRRHLKSILTSPPPSPPTASQNQDPALKIFSIHWGPNYSWHPDPEIRSLAYFLIDECGVDIVHGHSAHHVQGVERYKGGVIIYGCGDFVDDYALNRVYRNDLGGVWRVVLREVEGQVKSEGKQEEGRKLVLDRLEMFPTRCERFQVNLLEVGDEDHEWVRRRIAELSEELGTNVRGLGRDGQIVIDLQD